MARFKPITCACTLGLAAMLLVGCTQIPQIAKAPDTRTEPVVDFSACDQPAYPPPHRILEEGTVTMSFLINTEGKVAGSKILRSSGFRSLDKAAIVGIAKCRFKPATLNGVPEQAWVQMQYVWKLP